LHRYSCPIVMATFLFLLLANDYAQDSPMRTLDHSAGRGSVTAKTTTRSVELAAVRSRASSAAFSCPTAATPTPSRTLPPLLLL
jgi:hypothetical protein